MKVKNPFGETRFVPGVGREVEAGEIIEVPDADLASYLEGGWEAADTATKAEHQRLLQDKADGKPGVTVGKLKKTKADPKPADGDKADDKAADEPAAEEPAGGGDGEGGEDTGKDGS